MEQILQNITFCLLENLLVFSVLYFFYLVIKTIFSNALKANIEFLIITSFLSIGTFHFLYKLLLTNYTKKMVLDFDYSIFQNTFLLQISFIIGLLYIILLIANMIIKVVNTFLNREQKRNYSIVANNSLQNSLNNFSKFINIKTPELYTSTSTLVPFTKGFFKKIIVLPVSLFFHLTEEELEAIILHEMAHIKRYDIWFNILFYITNLFLFFNPFVKIFIKNAKFQRELACDDWVLNQNIKPINYATTLQKLAMFSNSKMPLQLAMNVPKYQLLYRIQRIFNQHYKTKISYNFLPFTSLLFVVLLFNNLSKKNIETIPLKGNNIVYNNSTSPVIIQKATSNKEQKLIPVIKNNITINKHQIINVIAKKTNAILKTQTEITKLPILQTVANNNSDQIIKTEIHNKIAFQNNTKLQILDSIIYYSKYISASNIMNSTMQPLQNLIQTITTLQNEDNKSIAITSIPIVVNVTQQGAKNIYYNNVLLNQECIYNKKTNEWIIEFTITNNNKKLAIRIITLNSNSKLHSIDL